MKRAKVYSHPRSGTHLLMASLERNFYQDVDTAMRGGKTGHWANRRDAEPTAWGEMFGSHRFYHEAQKWPDAAMFYVYRDGRDVAVSLWNAKAMQHPDWAGLTFSEFLQRPLDWRGTPGRGARPRLTIGEHWRAHLESWADKPDVMYVCYETLVLYPYSVLMRAGAFVEACCIDELVPVRELVGVTPNRGRIGEWATVFSAEDTIYWHSVVEFGFWGEHYG